MRGNGVVRLWRWTVESLTRIATSDTVFKSLDTCIADAKLHGSDAHIAAEADALPQSSYTVHVLEDGTVTVSPGA